MTLTGKDVFILGAGFSVAVSASASPNDIAMPLMDELSECVRERERVGAEFAQVEEGIGTPGFEAVLDALAVHAPWRSEPQRLRARALFQEVVDVVDDVIRDRETATRQRAMSEYLRVLVEHWRATQSNIITFNYDLLIEAAFSDSVNSERTETQGVDRMAYRYLYPLGLQTLSMRAYTVFNGDKPPDSFRLLKLHGSRSLASPSSSRSRNEMTYLTASLNFWTPSQDEAEEDPTLTGDLQTIILPPTTMKSEYLGNNFVDRMWVVAHEAISEANHIVIIGYSLPLGDHLVRLMLQQSIKPGTRITLVDPNATKNGGLIDNYAKAISCEITPFTSLEEFMQATTFRQRTSSASEEST